MLGGRVTPVPIFEEGQLGPRQPPLGRPLFAGRSPTPRGPQDRAGRFPFFGREGTLTPFVIVVRVSTKARKFYFSGGSIS